MERSKRFKEAMAESFSSLRDFLREEKLKLTKDEFLEIIKKFVNEKGHRCRLYRPDTLSIFTGNYADIQHEILGRLTSGNELHYIIACLVENNLDAYYEHVIKSALKNTAALDDSFLFLKSDSQVSQHTREMAAKIEERRTAIQGMIRQTVVVIRTYNNNFIANQVDRALKLGFPEISVIVDVNKDKGSTTMPGGWLKNYYNDNRVKIIEMHEGYSWSNALNFAKEAIEISSFANEDKKYRFIFNLSVEAAFTKFDIFQLFEAFFDQKPIGVSGTNFKGILKGNQIDLGRSYNHPRNTGMIIKLDVFRQISGNFNPWCDQIGGMEDIEFILRMLIRTDYQYKQLKLMVKLVVGANHNQKIKETHEHHAMDTIILYYRSLFPDINSIPRKKIEEAINAMGLED
ncbi:hypothetical protein K8R32_03245 [bacterium]|nr:hypothetical protein [bacterium]